MMIEWSAYLKFVAKFNRFNFVGNKDGNNGLMIYK